ncbi:hypothetical protein [Lentzea sp. CC55]|uniref:hypothetical protein n=1 Tax=Lentzea sp. CC55 TaxID=2884909 RepID=UPI001F214E5B|nr:hypothetical protein [Lentzea sp. CC55]MCG8924224.1 hypothetical protein [Lentzea sp. CC55]
MLRELILFLEEFVRGHGPPAVAKAAVGLMSFAVLMGAALGSTAVKAGALVTAVLVITAAGIALITRLKSEQRELEVHKDLVSHYCKLLDARRPSCEVLDWDETITVDERGNARTSLKIKLQAAHDDLWFVRMRFGCGWPQPSRYRHRVRTTVRNLLANGSAGTTLRTTLPWPRDGAMAAIAHFHAPPPANSEVSLTIDLVWPKRCRQLLEGAPDEFALLYWQPVKRAVYRIVLPPGVEVVVEPISKADEQTGLKWRRKVETDGKETITFKVSDLPVRQRTGIRLQLKETRRTSRP